MKNSVLFLYLFMFGMILLGCRVPDTYYVYSPVDSTKRLAFTWLQSLIPGEQTYIKISIPEIPKSSIIIEQIMDFNIHIHWGDTIKVRGGHLISEDSNSGKINWLKNYTSDEYKEILTDTLHWRPYYLNLIPTGHYDRDSK